MVHIDGKDYTLKDTNWPTLDPKDPYRLSIEGGGFDPKDLAFFLRAARR